MSFRNKKKINYQFKGLHKTTCHKTKSSFFQFFFLLTAVWVFFLFLYWSVSKFLTLFWSFQTIWNLTFSLPTNHGGQHRVPIPQVDVQYLETLNELYNDLPFLPEWMKLEKIEKLVANLHDTHKKCRTSIQSWIDFEKNFKKWLSLRKALW